MLELRIYESDLRRITPISFNAIATTIMSKIVHICWIASAIFTLSLARLDQGVMNSIPAFQESSRIADLLGRNTVTEISVRRGMPFFLELPMDPAIGKRWEVSAQTLAGDIVKHMDKAGYGKVNKPKRGSTETTQRFTFVPEKVGNGSLLLEYRENTADEGKEKAEETTYRIEVQIVLS